MLKQLFILLFLSIAESAKIPSYVQLCKRNDPELSKCFVDSLMAILPHVEKGIPQMGLPSFQPLRLEKVQLNNDALAQLNIFGELHDVELYYATNVKVYDFHIDLVNKINCSIDVEFPFVMVKGMYKAKGQLLMFNLDAHGHFEANATNLKATGQWSGDYYTKSNKEYAKFNQNSCKLKSAQFHVQVGDLFKDNPELTENVNGAINENMDTIVDQFSSLIEDVLGQVTSDIFNIVYDKFSMDQLFPR